MDSYYAWKVYEDEISPRHRVYLADEVDKEIEQLKESYEKIKLKLKGLEDHFLIETDEIKDILDVLIKELEEK